MTADPKARRLSTEFFGQWLGFYHFDQYRGVDTGRFPEFTDEVKRAMFDEAVSTFEYIVRERRPVREILHADYVFVNQPLAKFYGLDVPVTSAGPVQRVDGAHAFDRGGALRLGAVLTTTSAPLRTSPGEARRLDPAPDPRHADAPAAGRRRHAAGRRQELRRADAPAAPRAAQVARRSAPRATCGSIRWGSRSNVSMRLAAPGTPTPTASPST